KLRRAHRGFDAAVAGDHDDRRRMWNGLQAAEGLKAVHAGKPDVEKNDFEIAARRAFQRFFGGLSGFDVITLVAEDGRERFADASFVVNHKDVWMGSHRESVAYTLQQDAGMWQRRDGFAVARWISQRRS